MSAAVLLMTTGCMKFDMNLDVSAQDTVSGTVTVGVSKALMQMAEQNGGDTSSLPQTDNLFSKETGATVKKFDDGVFVGNTYTIDAVSIEKFETTNKGSKMSITRDGDYIVVDGFLDLAGEDPESIKQAMENPFTSSLFDSMEFSVTMTLPGVIESTNGTREGDSNKIVWTGTLGENLKMEAKTRSPKSEVDLPLILGGVGVVIVIVAAVVLMRRKGSASATKSE